MRVLLRRMMARGKRAGCGGAGLRHLCRAFSDGGGSRKTAASTACEGELAPKKMKVDWDEVMRTLKRRKGPGLGTPDQNSTAAVSSRRATLEGAAKEAARLPPPDSWAHLATAVVAGSAASTLVRILPEPTSDDDKDPWRYMDPKRPSSFVGNLPGVPFLVGFGVAITLAPNTYARPYGSMKIVLGMTCLSVTKVVLFEICRKVSAQSTRGSGSSSRPSARGQQQQQQQQQRQQQRQQQVAQEMMSPEEAERVLARHFGTR